MIAGGIVVALLVFYGGFSYGKTHASAAVAANGRNFGGVAAGGQGMGARMRTSAGQAGGFVIGKILSKDATSMTVSLQNGGSKIVFLASSTPVMKTVAGSVSDLAVGTTVQVTGSAGADGSVTARSVEIRPEMSAPMIRTN